MRQIANVLVSALLHIHILYCIFKRDINYRYMKTEFTSSFTEVQKFRQVWIWVLVSFLGVMMVGLFGYGFYKQIIHGEKFGDHPMSDTGLIITFVFVVILIVFLFFLLISAKLITEIDKRGIRYQFYPFHLRVHTISWDLIDHYNVVCYHPVKEYGGWGFRYFKNKRAFNVSGDKGLQLILKNGKKLLIGTQKGRELNDFLNRFK